MNARKIHQKQEYNKTSSSRNISNEENVNTFAKCGYINYEQEMDISNINDPEAQKEAKKLLHSWLRTEKQAEKIKNKVESRKKGSFYEGFKEPREDSALDLLEKKGNLK